MRKHTHAHTLNIHIYTQLHCHFGMLRIHVSSSVSHSKTSMVLKKHAQAYNNNMIKKKNTWQKWQRNKRKNEKKSYNENKLAKKN